MNRHYFLFQYQAEADAERQRQLGRLAFVTEEPVGYSVTWCDLPEDAPEIGFDFSGPDILSWGPS